MSKLPIYYLKKMPFGTGIVSPHTSNSHGDNKKARIMRIYYSFYKSALLKKKFMHRLLFKGKKEKLLFV